MFHMAFRVQGLHKGWMMIQWNPRSLAGGRGMLQQGRVSQLTVKRRSVPQKGKRSTSGS